MSTPHLVGTAPPGGVQAQLLIFRTVGRSSSSLAGILAEAQALAELVDAMVNRRITRLQQLFPAAALTFGRWWGASFGLNFYEGIWSVSDRDV